MAYGVLYGNTGVNKIPLARTILPINNIVAGVGIVAGATANTFTCGELGLHQIDLDLQMSAPTNDTPFTLQLWNVTTNTLVQARAGTAPQQSWASDMYFGFEWTNPNLTDEYAFYVVPNVNVALNGFALLLQDLNFRAVVQEFGGAGVGPGTVGAIAKFTGIGAIGDSIMTEAGAVISVAGSVNLAGTNANTFLSFTDGQNVPVSAANTGRIRYNTALQTFQFSENTGAWADLSGVGPGTVNRIAKFLTANTVGDSSIADTGVAVVQTQTAAAGANATAFTINAAAHTNVPTTVETIDVDFNLDRTVQHATGAIATQRAVVIRPPTYSFVGASTITDASTVAITGVPAAGANCVITNAWALNVAGPTRIGGKLTVTGGIDPTFLELAGADTNTYLNMIDGKNVAVSAGGQGRMRYNVTAQKFEFSENGGAYSSLPVATGTVNYIPKCTNTVGPVYGNSGITDAGAATFTLRDATNQVLAFGTTAAVFNVANTAGVDQTIRARDANSTTTFSVTPTAVLADYTLNGTYGIFTSTGAHGLVPGQTVVIAGFTDNNFNGTFTVYDCPTATTFRVLNALAGVCTVIGTMTATTARAGSSIILQAGAGASGGARGTVQCPGEGGLNSVAIGLQARAYNAGPSWGIAIGCEAECGSGTGISIGLRAGFGSIIKTLLAYTIAIGDSSLGGGGAGTTGDKNIAIGSSSLTVLTSGTENCAVGNGTLLAVTTGSQNTALGETAGLSTGANQVASMSLGFSANATANYAVAAGANSAASGQFSVVLGAGDTAMTYANPTASAVACIALGAGAQSRITETINISGLDCARKDDAQANYWLNYGSRTNIIYGPEVDFLGAPADYTVTVPANCKAWVEETGWIQTVLTLDGGALTVQPTVRFGITGTPAKLLAAAITTLLTAAGTRERYTTLLSDVGETTLTAGVTIAGTIAGGGAGIAYKGRPYWVVRVVENE
jgi:hypothetical protein